MKILVLNAGSSSQKSRLYEIGKTLPEVPPVPLWEANADWTGTRGKVTIKIQTAQGQSFSEETVPRARQQIVEEMVKTLWNGRGSVLEGPEEITAVGHRVVHGGAKYRESTRITPEVKEAISDLAAFAPLHNPANLEGIEGVERILGNVPQFAVFDTAFHSSLLPESAIYPGPYAWFEQGIRRYGFHGTSHQYCAERTAHILKRDLKSLRLINCHLGNGCSLAAIRDGRSTDTTMGFTPLEGLMMGSRSGTVDPSILLYLQRQQGYNAEQLDNMLNKESGLLGISGVSSDMRQVLQAIAEGNKRAKLALDIYNYRLRFFIGAMLATLGGVDVITFTGGIGENAASVRAAVCEGFSFLNLKLDHEKNATSPADQDIAALDSAIRVLIVHTEEDWQIAKECWQAITGP